MKYKYPKLRNSLLFKRMNDCQLQAVECLTGNEYVFGINAARYAKKLDGRTHPYRIRTPLNKAEVDEVLAFLEDQNLTRKSDITKTGLLAWSKALWIPESRPRHWVGAWLANAALMLLWLPALLGGFWFFLSNCVHMSDSGLLAGALAGVVAGMLLHELGHILAGVAYGARIFEAGLLLRWFGLAGAYVQMDTAPVKRRMHRVQIDAAGVEMNFLLAGVCFLLGGLVPMIGGMCLAAGISNVALGAANLLLLGSLDGNGILGELMGEEVLMARVLKVVFSRAARKKTLQQGAHGYAAVAMCYTLLAMQLAYPLLLILNLVEVVRCVL